MTSSRFGLTWKLCDAELHWFWRYRRRTRPHQRANDRKRREQQRDFDVIDNAVTRRGICERYAEVTVSRQRRHHIPDRAAARDGNARRGRLRSTPGAKGETVLAVLGEAHRGCQ